MFLSFLLVPLYHERYLTFLFHNVCFVNVMLCKQTRRMPNGKEDQVLAVGLACSECFSGPNLAKILQPGFAYESRVMAQLSQGIAAEPLSLHTSAGITNSIESFIHALHPHIPWQITTSPEANDWCVSLQMEGASAVWAAIDMLLQVRQATDKDDQRSMVAVGATSYHGPPSTSFGSSTPLWKKPYQLTYPVPQAGQKKTDQELKAEYAAFLEHHGSKIGVILFEPQWGSSQAGLPWSKDLLRHYIAEAKAYGIKVLCDEIMCGLGRHGKGTLFVSKAWDLDPDAVTFGKAIGGGVYPLSGAILKEGCSLLATNGRTVMQSHTYAGSSVRALMTATQVLLELPRFFPGITKLGTEMEHIFTYLSKISDGLLICHGQGLMWGGLFTHEGQCQEEAYRTLVVRTFKQKCSEFGVLPYHVPNGGFMVSPVIDIDVGTVYTMGERLEAALRATITDVEWDPSRVPVHHVASEASRDMKELIDKVLGCQDVIQECLPVFHNTRSCTSCSAFVHLDRRLHFLTV
jgi:adenosylmethionine-8-amino-7-oxononanoate aminotransferase